MSKYVRERRTRRKQECEIFHNIISFILSGIWNFRNIFESFSPVFKLTYSLQIEFYYLTNEKKTPNSQFTFAGGVDDVQNIFKIVSLLDSVEMRKLEFFTEQFSDFSLDHTISLICLLYF